MLNKIQKISQLIESVGQTPIRDEAKYTQEMTRSFIDKLFFIDLVDADVIVDFGCADAFILSKIRMLNPEITLIGYDLDKQMLANARLNLDDNLSILTDDWNQVANVLKEFKKPLLLLSSVIHEVYSYTNSRQVNKFWNNQVFSGLFHYIVIRDMVPTNAISRVRDFQNDVEKVRALSDSYYLKTFEKKWGDISKDYRTFIHYLLKYKYKENWDRELLENYVPLSLQTLISKIPKGYKIIFQDTYIYGYLRKIVKEDFDVDIKQTTHLKMILEKS